MNGDLCGALSDYQELVDLRWHWDLAYDISVRRGLWTARFLKGPDLLSAGSAGELRRLIRADYMKRQVASGQEGAAEGAVSHQVGAGEAALRRLRDQGVI
jgi:hypothetical protein